MIRSLYTATSAMMTQGTDKYDSLVQNLVNASTPGFRGQYIRQVNAVNASQPLGSDVQVSASEFYEDTRPGSIEYTGEKLDVDLEGDSYLVVQTGDGLTGYTRNGRMKMQADGVVTDRMGNRIMGRNGPIKIPPTAADIVIDPAGNIFADGAQVGSLSKVSFPQGTRMKPIGGGISLPPPGVDPTEAEGAVSQGYYERSNVNPVEEMVRLLTTVRNVESYGKFITAAVDDTTAQLIRQTGKVG